MASKNHLDHRSVGGKFIPSSARLFSVIAWVHPTLASLRTEGSWSRKSSPEMAQKLLGVSHFPAGEPEPVPMVPGQGPKVMRGLTYHTWRPRLGAAALTFLLCFIGQSKSHDQS